MSERFWGYEIWKLACWFGKYLRKLSFQGIPPPISCLRTNNVSESKQPGVMDSGAFPSGGPHTALHAAMLRSRLMGTSLELGWVHTPATYHSAWTHTPTGSSPWSKPWVSSAVAGSLESHFVMWKASDCCFYKRSKLWCFIWQTYLTVKNKTKMPCYHTLSESWQLGSNYFSISYSRSYLGISRE